MKLVFSLFTSVVVGAGAAGLDFMAFDASSKAAQKLIRSSQAVDSSRILEDSADQSFVADSSIYFDGCHNTTSWVDNSYSVVPLVRFRLCPTKYVHSGKCFTSKVGEYLTPMTTFVDAYMEYHLSYVRQQCENMRETCGCDDKNDDCLYNCYTTYNGVSWSQCSQEQGKEERLGECQKLEIKNNGRLLEQNQDSFYMGPFCGPGGSGVFLTLFTDQYCSKALPDAASFYSYVAGTDMPYQYKSGSTGMVDKGWLACTAQDNGGNNNNNGNNKDAKSSQLCEDSYDSAVKCETNLTNLAYPDTSGCSYIAHIKSQGNVSFQLASVNMSWAALFFIVGGVAVLGSVSAYIRSKKRSDSSKSDPLVIEVELS